MCAVSLVCPLAGTQAGEQLPTSPVQPGRSLSWDSRAARVQETAGDKNIQVKSVLADFMIYLLFPETMTNDTALIRVSSSHMAQSGHPKLGPACPLPSPLELQLQLKAPSLS